MKTASNHLMPHNSICIMDLPALKTIPILHGKWTCLHGQRASLRPTGQRGEQGENIISQLQAMLHTVCGDMWSSAGLSYTTDCIE